MDDIYTYVVTLPEGVNEVVLPCADGHTIYLSDRLDRNARIREYKHALHHITAGDFQRDNVQEIEHDAHKV